MLRDLLPLLWRLSLKIKVNFIRCYACRTHSITQNTKKKKKNLNVFPSRYHTRHPPTAHITPTLTHTHSRTHRWILQPQHWHATGSQTQHPLLLPGLPGVPELLVWGMWSIPSLPAVKGKVRILCCHWEDGMTSYVCLMLAHWPVCLRPAACEERTHGFP